MPLTNCSVKKPVDSDGLKSHALNDCSAVKAIDIEDKEDLAAFPFDEEAEFQSLGGALPVGEKGYTTLERR